MSTTAGSAVCTGSLRLTRAEHTLLASLPHGAQPVRDDAWCELEAGHAGPHYTLGQISGPTWWWLRWSDDGAAREFVDGGFCGAATGGGDCSLPHRHAGAHSFLLDCVD